VAADGYSLTATLYRFPVDAAPTRQMHNDVKRLPLDMIDKQGRVTRVRN
jgi:hypothetical protein